MRGRPVWTGLCFSENLNDWDVSHCGCLTALSVLILLKGGWAERLTLCGRGLLGGEAGFGGWLTGEGGGVYSASIGRMGAGAASSLKIANALLFPPRNSQESYLWIKRGCETSQRWTLHNNDSTQNKQLWQNNSYSNIKNMNCHYKIKEQCFEPGVTELSLITAFYFWVALLLTNRCFLSCKWGIIKFKIRKSEYRKKPGSKFLIHFGE